ncbi:hypothetical protein J3R30DRAFT_3401573 [Lentinula aciculospora]|uniref:Homeobox domain-containing protein n=1 Tax=Lentinula aciculospora TaxID=153920 RepID=A0A9W9ALM5_9AGAR|nr:hypothetical protein J3R30DRAFT_3401573 [Lentinula aciculospora]
MDVQKLKDLRQRVARSRARFETIHETHFGSSNPPAPLTVDIDIPPLQLVIPPAIQAQLEEYLLTIRASEIISKQFDKVVQDYVDQFEESSRKLAQIPQLRSHRLHFIQKLRVGLQNHFETHGLPKIMEKVVEYAKEHPSRSSPPPTPPSVPPYQPPVPFNNEYTPILETYFQYDPYPSARDRQIIADRSGMQTRQIEVWFQNHRKRARQQGIRLPPRRPSGAIAPPGLDTSNSSDTSNTSNTLDQLFGTKAKMLDLFNINFDLKGGSESSNGTTALTKSKGSLRAMGSGKTPNDPIQIDTADMTSSSHLHMPDSLNSLHGMTTTSGMTITPAGNGISILEPIDVVERMVREKAGGKAGRKERMRKKEEEGREMWEEKDKFLSIIAPPSFLPLTPSSQNPLDFVISNVSSTSPTSTPTSVFPAPFIRPSPELQFRYRVAPSSLSSSSSPPTSPTSSSSLFSNNEPSTITGTTRPLLPSPTWTRLAPSTSYEVPPPPTSITPRFSSSRSSKAKQGKMGKNDKIGKNENDTIGKRLSQEDLQTQARQLEEAEDLMLERAWFWSIDDNEDEDVVVQSRALPLLSLNSEKSKQSGDNESAVTGINTTTATSSAKSVKSSTAKSKAKSILEALGIGSDAATCAYTYVLPKAPFWALVQQGGSLVSSFSASTFASSSSTAFPLSLNDTNKNTDPGMDMEISVSSSHGRSRGNKTGSRKPAALGPKRKPKNAPTTKMKTKGKVRERGIMREGSGYSSHGSGSSSPEPEHPRDVHRFGSDSSLGSTSSSSSYSSTSSTSSSYSLPQTPPPTGIVEKHDSVRNVGGDDSILPTSSTTSVPSKITSRPIPIPTSSVPKGFPEGFIPFSNTDMGMMGMGMDMAMGIAMAKYPLASSPVQGSQSSRPSGSQHQSQQSQSQTQYHNPQPQEFPIGFGYAFGNPYNTSHSTNTNNTTNNSNSNNTNNSNDLTTSSSFDMGSMGMDMDALNALMDGYNNSMGGSSFSVNPNTSMNPNPNNSMNGNMNMFGVNPYLNTMTMNIGSMGTGMGGGMGIGIYPTSNGWSL